jgi:zinc D-Ala-D-Ala carboxypeptidase
MKRSTTLRIRQKLAVTFVAAALVGAVGFAAPAQASTRCVDNVYGYGGYSTCVGYIQQLLNYFKMGASSSCHKPATDYTRLTVDNSFGTKTQNATIYFQRYWCLTVDGRVGPQTWKILCGPQQGPGIPAAYPLTAARAAGCNI